MNPKPTRAPSKDMAPRPRRQSLLARGTWKNLLALTLVALLSAVSAFANYKKQIGRQGINGPRGTTLGAYSQPCNSGRCDPGLLGDG